MQLIDAMIVGAQKAGTTSLKYYLSQHPQILTHRNDEFTYFSVDKDYKSGFNRFFKKRFDRYPKPNEIVLAKSATIMSSEKTLVRLYEHNPRVKLIFVLRNPVERAYSAYWYARRIGWEEEAAFSKAIESSKGIKQPKTIADRTRMYLHYGLYVEHIKKIQTIFGETSLSIHLFEDLVQSPASVCREIFGFCDVDDNFIPNFIVKKNQAAMIRSTRLTGLLNRPSFSKNIIRAICPDKWQEKLDKLKQRVLLMNEYQFNPPPMEEGIKDVLLDYFLPYNRKLAKMIDRDLSMWNKI